MAHFSSDFHQFLRDLRDNNAKPWFDANKPRFEASVKGPMVRFVADLAPELAGIAPEYRVELKPQGGSIMRIYRDTRFSKDKTPYKTNMAAHFGHGRGREGACPALYLHFGPGQCGVGGGIWQPDAPALHAIRSAIAAQPDQWRNATAQFDARSACGLMGETLKRPPVGFDPSHPCIADIQRKDFAVSRHLDDDELLRDDFLAHICAHLRATLPFLRFLERAVGL